MKHLLIQRSKIFDITTTEFSGGREDYHRAL